MSPLYFRIIFTSLFGLLFTSQVLSANIESRPWYGHRSAIYIRGEIVTGDADTFKRVIISELRDGHVPYLVLLNSVGGDVPSALDIGRQIRTLGMATTAPRKTAGGDATCTGGMLDMLYYSTVDCTCMSACFLIWSSGVGRDGDVVGIHRPRYDSKYFASLSVSSAQDRYASLDRDVRTYLSEMNIPENISNKMFQVPSGGMYFLTKDEISALDNIPGWKSELIAAKCGQAPKGTFFGSKEMLDFRECGSSIYEDSLLPGAKAYLSKYGAQNEHLPPLSSTFSNRKTALLEILRALTTCETTEARIGEAHSEEKYIGSDRQFAIETSATREEGNSYSSVYSANFADLAVVHNNGDGYGYYGIECRSHQKCVHQTHSSEAPADTDGLGGLRNCKRSPALVYVISELIKAAR